MNTGDNGVTLSQSSHVLPQVLFKLALLLLALLIVFTPDQILLTEEVTTQLPHRAMLLGWDRAYCHQGLLNLTL